MQQNSIRYLTRKEIANQSWDACIDHSSNGLVYAYSFYLDTMTDNWDALVLNDYQVVMPLAWRKKYGIQYLYQPAFVAQLGLFGNHISAEWVQKFLSAIPSKFKYWDFTLNHNNVFPKTDFPLYQRSNFVLSLNRPYEDLFNRYRDNIKRNIKKAKGYGCSVESDIAIEQIIGLAREQVQQNQITDKDFNSFTLLYHALKQKSKAISYGVFSQQHQLLASCVFFFSHKRAYYILVGNHPNGRTLGASHLLIDAFIRDYAGQDLLLDFEGSDLRNLAFFYSSFGAEEEKYAAIQLNRLPWYIRWLKN